MLSFLHSRPAQPSSNELKREADRILMDEKEIKKECRSIDWCLYHFSSAFVEKIKWCDAKVELIDQIIAKVDTLSETEKAKATGLLLRLYEQKILLYSYAYPVPDDRKPAVQDKIQVCENMIENFRRKNFTVIPSPGT